MNLGNMFGGAGSGALAGGSIGGPWGAAIGGGLGLINSFLNDPYSNAEKGINRGFQNAQRYQEPFFNNGLAQYNRLNQATNSLLNPAQLENEWSNSYQSSPYAQHLLDLNNQQGQEAAASMGLGGSSAAINNIQQGASNIVNADRQQYLNDLMQKYMQGIGLGQNLYGVGAQAGTNLGQQAYGHGENLANLGYARAAAPGEALGQGAGMLFRSQNPPTFNFNGNNY